MRRKGRGGREGEEGKGRKGKGRKGRGGREGKGEEEVMRAYLPCQRENFSSRCNHPGVIEEHFPVDGVVWEGEEVHVGGEEVDVGGEEVNVGGGVCATA